MRRIGLLAIALMAVGCGSGPDISGTWTGSFAAPTHSKDLGSAIVGFVSTLAGPVTIEFNREGRFKASMAMGSVGQGTYSVNGNEVTLKPDADKGKPQTFRIDGDVLRLKKDFDSDPDFVLKRNPKG